MAAEGLKEKSLGMLKQDPYSQSHDLAVTQPCQSIEVMANG